MSPRELLLLAFNKKDADEMKERLARVLGENPPHVMTFHALANALVHPEESLVVDDASAGHNWKVDRGKNPDGSEHHNDLHLTRAEKEKTSPTQDPAHAPKPDNGL